MKKLSIDITCNEIKKSVPFHKIKNYIEDFFINELLTRKGIAVNSKMDTHLQVNLSLNKEQTYTTSLPPYFCEKDNARIYPVLISIGDRLNTPNPNVEFAFILYDAVCEFLLTNFKKVNKRELQDLKMHLDVKYLNSIIHAMTVKEAESSKDDSIKIPA
jgi:hypothetical protein